MKAKRDFKGFKKGQTIPADKFDAEKLSILVAYGFVALEKKKRTATKKKAEKVKE